MHVLLNQNRYRRILVTFCNQAVTLMVLQGTIDNISGGKRAEDDSDPVMVMGSCIGVQSKAGPYQ